MKINHIIVTVILLLALASCSEDSTTSNGGKPAVHKVSMTIQGGSFSHQHRTLETPLLLSSGATLDSTVMTTHCKVYGAPTDTPYSIDIGFPHYREGIYSWEGISKGSFINIHWTSILAAPNQFLSTTQGVTTINSYGKVGEPIIGEFSGKFIHRVMYDTVTITGNFSIQRVR